MTFKFGAIIATIENLSEDGALGATDAALKAAEVATDVAEGNAEQSKEATKIDYMDAAICDAQDANDQVENLLEAAEETMQEGGMSAKEARLLEISHESIMASIGMSARKGVVGTPVASLESYASGRTRVSATMVTVESLKESARTIAGNLVRALKAALATVINFVVGLMRNRMLMEKHLENLIKRVESIDAADVKKKDKISGGAAALSVDGVASVANAKKILDTASKLISASAEMAAAISSAKDGDAAASAVKSAVGGIGAGLFGGHGHLTNNRAVKVEEEDGSVKITITEAGKTAEEIAAPTKAEMLTLARHALAVIKELRAFEKTQTKLKDAISGIISRLSEVADVVKSKIGSEESKAKATEAAAVKKQARLARSILSKAGGSFPNAAFQAVKAVADYVTAGYRNFGTEKKEEKK